MMLFWSAAVQVNLQGGDGPWVWKKIAAPAQWTDVTFWIRECNDF